jgi:hypothetical protein
MGAAGNSVCNPRDFSEASQACRASFCVEESSAPSAAPPVSTGRQAQKNSAESTDIFFAGRIFALILKCSNQ